MSQCTPELPTVRCWSEARFARFVRDLARDKALISVIPSAEAIINQLVALNLARRVETSLSDAKPATRFVIVDFSTGDNHDLDPLELAQAFMPQGVLCYFGALSYHGLTTQVPPFYHIAQLDPSNPIPRNIARRESVSLEPSSREALGTLAFEYQGTSIYSTKRLARTVSGYRTYLVGPRTSYRMTSLEQTLVDCLHHPTACGGPPVIYEAWEEGAAKVNIPALEKVLEGIAPVLRRRTATMMERCGLTVAPQIAKLLATPSEPVVPLFPGFPAGTSESRWGVLV